MGKLKPRSFLWYGFRKRGQQVVVRRIPCEVYSRIVGYLRPIQHWNVGKRQEWKERKVYDCPVLDD